MDTKILVVSNNNEVSLKLKAVSEFLGKPFHLAEGLDSATKAIQSNNDISVGLVSLTDQSEESKLVHYLQSYFPKVDLRVVRNGDGAQSYSHRFVPDGIEVLQLPDDQDKILQVLGNSTEIGADSAHSSSSRDRLTGESQEISRVRGLIDHVSNTDANVLLLGESGTGKEVVARTVHDLSARAEKPFIAVNCAAIPADLLESELFGYEKGAFTGASTTRQGRFELAEGGTIFLDEIGDMPLSMQVKLLRVIQERSFERVGGTKSINCDVRLVAATHQNLEKCIDEGKFRMDLFYRLNVFPIDIPPLRKRITDIPLLIKEFAEKSRNELGHLHAIEFDEAATQALCDHQLPGNVRELQNLVERLSILFPEELISLDKLPERYQGIDPLPDTLIEPAASSLSNPKVESELLAGKFNLKDYLTTLEKNLIYQALNNTNWVVTQAAESLCLRRTTLIQKIRRLNIEHRDKQNMTFGV